MSGKGKMSPSRRELLADATSLVAGAALAATTRVAQAAPPTKQPHRFGMAIDLGRCLRCQTCVVACAAENNVPPLGVAAAPRMRPIHWMDMLVPANAAVPSPLGPAPAPIPCMHCEQPACVRACPVGATYRADDGVVAQIWDRCIGCRACMVACPYSRRYYNWAAPAWPGGDASSANPDVALRPAGVEVLENRVMEALGEASYPFYLLHNTVISSFFKLLTGNSLHFFLAGFFNLSFDTYDLSRNMNV